MDLNASRRAKLVTMKILEYAEIGGMAPEDCGVALEAISNCLDNVGSRETVEETLEELTQQIAMILKGEEWGD